MPDLTVTRSFICNQCQHEMEHTFIDGGPTRVVKICPVCEWANIAALGTATMITYGPANERIRIEYP